MAKINKAKSVAQQLKEQLSQAKNTQVKQEKAQKLILEFNDKKGEQIYSFVLFQKGKEFRNLSSREKDGVTYPIYEDQIKIIERIIEYLDDDNFELVKYNSKWDIIESQDFNEDSLRFFVKKVKEEIINRIKE